MAYTADQIAEAIRVSKEQGFSEADILKGLASYGVTAEQAAAALAPPVSYTPAQVSQAIATSRAAGFSDADIATGLERYRVPVVQTAGAYTPTGTTYTPTQITNAIETSRAQGFSDADIATGLQRYLPTAAAVTTALTANPRAVATTGTTGGTGVTGTTSITPIVRPTTPTQPTYTQLAPASVTNTAITGTPYTNIYTPATMQQNAPTLAQINAASQSANPYQSLMALTPQRTLSPAYAGALGQTTANTNLGGYDTSIYSKPLTGLLAPSTVAGGGGTDLVNNSGDARGPGSGVAGGIPGLNIDPLAYGMARVANLFSSPISISPAPIISAAFNPTQAGIDYAGVSGKSSWGKSGDADQDIGALNHAKGGMVNMKPQMNNPPGPDDGYAALDNGEYVIRKSAVKKYGSNIFEQINAGKIPAQRLKSLLE